MSRNYPMWLSVNADGKDKSFGSNDQMNMSINVGSSKTNSHSAGRLYIESTMNGNIKIFNIWFNDVKLKSVEYDMTSKNFVDLDLLSDMVNL